MRNFVINPSGEFTLSRDAKNLRDQFGVTGVVTGTIISSEEQLVINARVIDSQSGLVISSGQIQIPSNWFTDALLEEPRTQNIRIVSGP